MTKGRIPLYRGASFLGSLLLFMIGGVRGTMSSG